jgi:hypothetical protein
MRRVDFSIQNVQNCSQGWVLCVVDHIVSLMARSHSWMTPCTVLFDNTVRGVDFYVFKFEYLRKGVRKIIPISCEIPLSPFSINYRLLKENHLMFKHCILSGGKRASVHALHCMLGAPANNIYCYTAWRKFPILYIRKVCAFLKRNSISRSAEAAI